MTPAVRFVAIGDVMVDVTISGREHRTAVRLRPGGSATNAALWAASLGAEAVLIGRVGDDFAGRALPRFLAEAGIRADLAVDPTLPTGTFATVDGELRVDRGANAGSWALAGRHTADVALISGYLPLEAIVVARGLLDAPCVALGLGRLDRVPVGVDFDVIVGDAEEARRVTGEADPLAAARVLSSGARLACVTLAADGVVAARGDDVLEAAPTARYPDGGVGAGDAFAAGLLVALAAGRSVDQALAFACEAGSRALASGGAPGTV